MNASDEDAGGADLVKENTIPPAMGHGISI